MNPAKAKQKELSMHEIWESWNWHFYDKLRSLDHLTRHITKEMSVCGVPPDMYIPFLQGRLMDGIAQCTEQAKEEAKPKDREVSSLVAIRQKRREGNGNPA